MRIHSQSPKPRTLVDAKLVLLIDDDQPKPGKLHTLLQKGLSTDDKIHLAAAEPGQCVPPGSAAERARQQQPAYPAACQIAIECPPVLLSQDLRRGHEDRLVLIG